MDFNLFKAAVAARWADMQKYPLFRTAATKDELWDTYLNSFPKGSNPIYRERAEHDCSCCKQFIRAIGNVVAIMPNNNRISLWDLRVEDPAYQVVTDAMALLNCNRPVENVFLHTERTAGTDKNFEEIIGGQQTWTHFFAHIADKNFCSKDSVGTKLGDHRSTYDVLKRGLEEITVDALDTMLELIAQNSLYRGAEHGASVTLFRDLKLRYTEAKQKEHFLWRTSVSAAPSIARLRNTSIGTLLVDLSGGMELDAAVRRFEAMVAPANYKRPTALVTKAMIDKAKKTVEELGLTSALERRYATINDITINNILFADRSAPKGLQAGPFDQLATKPKDFGKVEEVTAEQFFTNILPTVKSLEVMMDNSHANNLVSLIAPVDPTAPQLFKWPNKFSWSYNGEFADSIKERVKAAGGNVTGELCCRLAWDYSDDLDFHMHEPNGSRIYFGNRRRNSPNGGQLDVDANGCDGIRTNPVENIFYDKLHTMHPGDYKLVVNNYSRRSAGVGFEAEIDILGQVHSIVYDKVLRNGETVTVVVLRKAEDGTVSIVESLPSTKSVKRVWNIDTNTFQKVSVVMLSPNFWDDKTIGNKHYFFMLDGCRNEGKARGFFNEFLTAELNEHRKVMEMVGCKMKTEESDKQLSGLGFSSTQRNSLICRVQGSFTRTIRINF